MAGSHGNIWKKVALLPLWIVQLIAAVIFLGISAFTLWTWNRVSDDLDEYDQDLVDAADDIMDISAAINLSFAAYTILSDFVEMLLFCTHRLAPVLNICLQCVKSAIWTVYVAMTIIALTRGGAGIGSLILVLVLFVTSLLLLGQAAQVVHKKRKGTLYRGDYAAAANPVRYESNPYDQTTGYTGGAAQNPFRDPTPAPPPYNPQATHPAHRPAGEAGDYYGGAGNYEMQHTTGK